MRFESLQRWSPQMLSVLRIVAGLVILQFGTAKILGFPAVPMFAKIPPLIVVAGTIELVPFTEPHAREAARLRPRTRHIGLSLADRACLALGRLHRLPVLTTDRAWRSLRISVKIEVIR